MIAGGLSALASYHDFDEFVVHVGEAREAEEMKCCSPLVLSLGF